MYPLVKVINPLIAQTTARIGRRTRIATVRALVKVSDFDLEVWQYLQATRAGPYRRSAVDAAMVVPNSSIQHCTNRWISG